MNEGPALEVIHEAIWSLDPTRLAELAEEAQRLLAEQES